MIDRKERCLFCERPENLERVIFHSNKNFYVLLDQFPVNPGHRLIIPRDHVEKIEELDSEAFSELQNTIGSAKSEIGLDEMRRIYEDLEENPVDKRSEELVKDSLNSKELSKNPEGFNIGINEGEAAGQTIPHLHIHLIPRYNGDVENPEGGVRNIIPEKGNYRD